MPRPQIVAHVEQRFAGRLIAVVGAARNRVLVRGGNRRLARRALRGIERDVLPGDLVVILHHAVDRLRRARRGLHPHHFPTDRAAAELLAPTVGLNAIGWQVLGGPGGEEVAEDAGITVVDCRRGHCRGRKGRQVASWLETTGVGMLKTTCVGASLRQLLQLVEVGDRRIHRREHR